MSKPGALSKKELAEAGRRKLEEFKRRKQEKSKGTDAGPGSTATPGLSEAAAVTAPTTLSQTPAVSAASAAASQLPASPCIAAGVEGPAKPAQGAIMSIGVSNPPVQPAPYKTNSAADDNSVVQQSTAARAAAAGAAAAELEAALMGLPSVAATAVGPHQASSQLPSLTSAPTLKAQPHGAAEASKPYVPGPFNLITNSSNTYTSKVSSPVHAAEQPSKQPWQPTAAADAVDITMNPPAQLQQQQQHTQVMPAAVSAAVNSTGSFSQRTSWLSLFGGQGSAQQPGPQEQQQQLQHEQQQQKAAQPPLSLPQQQQQPGQYDSLLLYHHSASSRPPSIPGQTSNQYIPHASAALMGSKPPAPWMPSASAAITSGTDLQHQPWMSGMPAAGSGSPDQHERALATTAATGNAAVHKAHLQYAELSDTYLAPVDSQSSSKAGEAAATMPYTNGAAKHQQLQQQSLQQPDAAAGGQSSTAAASPAETLSEDRAVEHAGGRAEGVGAVVSTWQQAASSPLGVVTSSATEARSHAHAPATLDNDVYGYSSSTALVAAPHASGQTGDAVVSKATANGDAAGSNALGHVQQHQQQAVQPHGLLNGNISRPGSFGSFASMGAAAGKAAATDVGASDRPSPSSFPAAVSAAGLAALGAGTSVASGSVAGSGPPSTSGGFSAMSYIQAHAENANRNAANLKLLQQHIDELTMEKLELMRGLQQQAKANEALADENRALGEQHNSMAAKLEGERQAVNRLQGEVEAAAASLAALVGQRDVLRAAAQEATDRANTLAAENVALENQLLELKSLSLRTDQEAKDASAAVVKLESQLAQLGSSAGKQDQELQGLQSERRILKARLMQAEARMRAAGLEPLPPMPAGMAAADATAAPAVVQVDAEVQTEWQAQQQYQLPPDTTAIHAAVLQPTAEAVNAAGKQLLDPVLLNEQAAAVLAGLEQWLPRDILAAAEAAVAASNAGSPQQQQQHTPEDQGVAPSDVQGGDPAYGAALSASYTALVGGDVWQEEARLVSSITELAAHLEGSWLSILEQLQQSQAQKQELQQTVIELQNQLTSVQSRCEQQEAALLQQQQRQPQQQQQQQHVGQTAIGLDSEAQERTQHAVASQRWQDPKVPEQQGAQQQQQAESQQYNSSTVHGQQAAPNGQTLPVSATSVSYRAHGVPEINAEPADGQLHAMATALSPETVMSGKEVPVWSAESVVGSTNGNSQDWVDDSTATSRSGGRGWFGAWGRRGSQRSALV